MTGFEIQLAAGLRGHVRPGVLRSLAHGLNRAAHRLGVGRSTVTLRLCQDAEMAELHRQHMGLAGPTDVLSFPAMAMPGDSTEHLGDIVIDWDAVLRQAPPSASGRRAEVLSLGVHGLVHLLGHDHATRRDGRRMLRLEQRAARVLGLGRLDRPYGGRSA